MPSKQQAKSFALEFDEHITVNNDALDTACVWIRENLEPLDVFTKDQLDKWAINNGYKKEAL